MKTGFFWLSIMLLAFGFTSCANEEGQLKKAEAQIDETDIARHISVLASDEFGGRAPASEGEKKTLDYLTRAFQELGVQPGNGDRFLQEVPLVEITADPNMTLNIQGKGQKARFKYLDEFVASTRRVQERVEVKNSQLVFVGYGIVAPEYDWNDYAGIDVKGKTVIMLVNDPGYATGDSTLFNGKAMTYYGRWTYKYEEAARQGAAGAIIIHQTGPAGYPWEVVRNSWSGAQFYLQTEHGNMDRCAFESWVTLDVARKIFQMAGVDLDTLTKAASQRGFKSQPLPLSVSLTIHNTLRYSKSNNFLALLPGSDRKNEYVIYMAHWDHLGINPILEGDSIFNGARDNATGIAALLEIAQAFKALPRPPRRSVLFLAVAAEEQGLLGSEYYATHPIYPLKQTVAAINMDGMNVFGPMKDVTIIGYGFSELDEYVKQEAKKQGRYVRPDPEPEKGYYFRSDHFNFAKQGVPALYADHGIEHVEHGEKWTLEKLDWWIKNFYHKPGDEYDPSWWDLSGMVQDVQLLFRVGYRLANSNHFPNWREGTEFRAKRDQMMAE